MKKPDATPQAVTDSVKRWCDSRNLTPESLDLRWDALNGNYFFEHNGTYFGVELSGYIHT